MAAEGEMIAASPSQFIEAIGALAETCQDADSSPPGVIEFTGSPLFTMSIFDEARAMKERTNEGIHGAGDPLRCFINGSESTVLEDVAGLGDLEVPRKTSSSNLSMRLVN